MDKRLRIAGIIGAVAFSIFVLTSPDDPLYIPEPTSLSIDEKSVEILATNLENPRSIAVSNDRIFVTEKEGKIIVIQNRTKLEQPLATLRPSVVFDGGLTGMTLHPDFESNNFIYVYFMYEENETLKNKIIRITENNNKLVDAVTILDGIPGSAFTNGGVMEFGPDKKLYVGTGVPSDSSHDSQKLDSLAGKVLRLNDDGTIPDDNPFADSPVYSLGHRNPQGLAWDMTEQLYLSEMGPEKNDEINLIMAGGNYGWPNQQCSGNEQYIDAVLCYDPSIEPGDILFYYYDRVSLEHSFVMASLRATNLYELDLEQGLKSQKSILGGVGRVRDVAQGSDGSLYVITSNTDGKGFPDSNDDKLLRIKK